MSSSIQAILFKFSLYFTLTAITILAFLPDYDALPPIVSFSDLLNHTIAFLTLYLLMHLAYPKLQAIHITAFLLMYGFFIELVQYFLPTRFASWSDVAADSVGLVLGFIIISIYSRTKQTK